MSRTQVKSKQLLDEGVKRADLNSTEAGSAVIKKLLAGNYITIGSTGVDEGTGDVTVNVNIDDMLALILALG
jgi:hypothetical protein